MYGGVGIYVSSNINNVLVLDNIAVEKTCLCPKCKIESLFLNFSYMNENYVIGGIYRHPNGIVNHFVNDLENTLVKFDNKTTIIIAGDMNVDLIKFENDNTINYLTTLLSNQYLPYVTLPTRITDFSATCIDHIFVRFAKNHKSKLNQIMSGIFYCDITDHLPCFLSIKIKLSNILKRPLTRIFGDRNCTRFIEAMGNENLHSVFWYSIFVAKVKQKYESSFPLIQISCKRLKDKPWITKGLKIRTKKQPSFIP